MTTVGELDFPHRVVVLGGDGHWRQVTVHATAPLTKDGIRAFTRHEDQVATRFGFVASSWVTQDEHGLYAGVLVYSVDPAASSSMPPGHPGSDRRFRGVGEAYAAPGGSARPVDAGEPVPLLWARREPTDTLVPVAVSASAGVVDVELLGAGLLPQGTNLLLGDPTLPQLLASSPTAVAAQVYAYRHPTREKVAARVAGGRAKPTAALTIGTLEQFVTAGGPG